jgi:hypothetical protein
MALETLKSFSSILDEDTKQSAARGSDVGFSDYLLDVPIGAVQGLSQAVQGLLQIGAMPIDYLANTNLLNGINNLFEKITPDTTTALGDITSVLVQFGVPYAGALKLASGIGKLKNLSTATKLTAPGMTRAAQGMELAKRAGYYGSMAGITDFAVSTPEKLGTLSDVTGLTEQTDFEGLEGKERAVETIKGKLKFGAEGTVIGGGVTLLPQVASIGFRYGIVPGAKTIGYVGGKALDVIDYPLTGAINAIVGKNEKSAIQYAISEGGALATKAGNKLGLSGDWRHTPVGGGMMDTIKRSLVRVGDQFKTDRGLTPEIRSMQVAANNALAGKEKTLKTIGSTIQEIQENIIKDYKIKFDDGDSLLSLQIEANKITDIIKAKTTKEVDDIIGTLNKGTNKEVEKELVKNIKNFKNIIDGTENQYRLFTAGTDLKNGAALDFGLFATRRFAAFNNKKFQFNPLLENKAFDWFKESIKGVKNKQTGKLYPRPGFEDNLKVAEEAAEKIIAPKNFQGLTRTKALEAEIDKQINILAKNKMLNLKQLVIKGNIEPSSLFFGVGEALGMSKDLVKEKGLPDVMKKLLSVEEGRTLGELTKAGKTATKDVQTYNPIIAGLDVVLNQSRQMHGKRVFDAILKEGLDLPGRPGLIFDEAAVARRGLDTSKGSLMKLSNIKELGRRVDVDDLSLTSDLFNGQYRAAPEIANALVGAKELTSSLYGLYGYKSMMTLKAGAQISKTILSPMTQVRNFTTASFFPLASGLIGGKVGFKDAWRLTAGDIFQGAKTDMEKIAKIENLIKRNVIDQNINVQEMKRVLEKAKDGKITFNTFMDSKVMQKLTDVYQGADNYWKIYSDNFYQGALKSAFGNPETLIKGSKEYGKFMTNVEDWYTTVAGQRFIKIDPLTGIEKTPLQALEDASAYLVTNTIPTYSKVPMIIEDIRNLPLGNFVAFPAEILRTTANIVSIGARELTSTNPFIRQMGARRLIGVSSVLGGIGYSVQKGAQYMTGVDEDTMKAFQSSFAPSYQKNSTLVPLSAPDENGNFKYYNFSYSNPYDTLVAPANAILGHFSDGTLRKDNVSSIVMNSLFAGAIDPNKRKGAITEFLTPFISESIGTERAVDVTVRGGKTSEGKLIYYPNDNADVIIGNSLKHIFGGLTPGAVTSATRIWDGATQTFTDYGTQRDAVDEVVALMSGVRVEEAKPLSSMPFILTSFNGDKNNMRSKFARKAYSARTSPEVKLGAYQQYLLESYDSQNKMFKTINDAQELGVSKTKLKKILEQRLTDTESKLLLKGVFKAPTFSENAFKSIAERLKGEDLLRGVEIESQNKNVMDIYNDLRRDLKRFKLGESTDMLNEKIDELLSPGVEEVRDTMSRTVTPTGGIFQSQVSLPVDPRKNVAVSPQVTNTGGQVMANATLGSRYLNGIDYNRMNTAQKADYVDKVFKV